MSTKALNRTLRQSGILGTLMMGVSCFIFLMIYGLFTGGNATYDGMLSAGIAGCLVGGGVGYPLPFIVMLLFNRKKAS